MKDNISEQKQNLPMLLIVLDGWGIAKPNKGNALALADTKNYNKLSVEYPYTTLCASGECVGLPDHQAGNSEAGHMNIGAGRIAKQDAVIIDESISDGTFLKNAAFREALNHIAKNKSRLHIMGMLSNGMSAHSDPKHLDEILKITREHKVKEVYLHLFTDGRDSPQYAALKLIEALERNLWGHEKIATIIGRFYAMDRKKTWERSEKAYNALVLGEGRRATSPQSAITESYNRGESDEFIQPYSIESDGKLLPRIDSNDAVIFFNLRSDRARQLAKTFVQDDFNKKNPGSFKRRKVLKNLCFVSMTDFGPDLDGILSAFPSIDLKETLPMQLFHYKQLYLAEKEKYAHVTYFFNGGYVDPVGGEDRMEIPSPDVASYDQSPAMKSKELADIIIDNLRKKKYDFTVVNFAAPDMVGHTGNLAAGIKACQAVDEQLGRIIPEYLKQNGTVIITADHGNIESMINLKTDEVDTEHSTNPVPFILVNNNLKNKKLHKTGSLRDIAPTVLDVLGLKKPKEMTGRSLIK